MLRAMPPFALFRKRTVWLPTLPGSLLLLAVAGGTVIVLGRALHPFLAVEAPVQASVLVVEGWLPPQELDQALERIRAGRYRQIITVGGPLPDDGLERPVRTYAEHARGYLVRRGLAPAMVFAVTSPDTRKDRTYLNALMLRAHFARSRDGSTAIDVMSSGVHSRRSWRLYQMALGDSRAVGILAAQPSQYAADQWWASSSGAKTVLGEAISWLWTLVFFHPDTQA